MYHFKFEFLTGVCLAAGLLRAVPLVPDSSVTVEQNVRDAVVVGYTLQNEDAVITVDFQTNGVSLCHAIALSGDVNRKIAPGAHTLTWLPAKDIGGNVDLGSVRAVITAWSTNAPPPYMAVFIESQTPTAPFYYASSNDVPDGVTHEKYKKRWLLMRKIPAANVWWRMGAGPAEKGQYEPLKTNEAPHMVQLTSDYYIGVYPVTQRQFTNMGGTYLSGTWQSGTGDYEACPVNYMTWAHLRGSTAEWPNATHAHTVDAGSMIAIFRTRTGIDTLDLPTAAQWEFAGRAGVADGMLNGTNVSAFAWNDPTPIREWAWVYDKDVSYQGVRPVGLLRPNNWGLYDMAGNAEEWCLDWYENVATTSDQVDPEGPASSSVNKRVIRGLGSSNSWQLSRCASSDGCVWNEICSRSAMSGFRLVCAAVAK